MSDRILTPSERAEAKIVLDGALILARRRFQSGIPHRGHVGCDVNCSAAQVLIDALCLLSLHTGDPRVALLEAAKQILETIDGINTPGPGAVS